MIADIREWERLLTLASTRIAAEYFQLPVAATDSAYRERVYTYELYHQLRLLWGSWRFGLSGEVDKTGHPYFRQGPYARSKPDLLVHVPGDMTSNLAVLEVKPPRDMRRRWLGDLKKLTWYIHNAQYAGGYFLVYGVGHEEVRRHIGRLMRSNELASSIKVWVHAAPGEAARCCGTVKQISHV